MADVLKFIKDHEKLAGDALITGGAVAALGSWWMYEQVASAVGDGNAPLVCFGLPAGSVGLWLLSRRWRNTGLPTLDDMRRRVYATTNSNNAPPPEDENPPSNNWTDVAGVSYNVRQSRYPIGIYENGRVCFLDFRETPHLIANGQTGSGKTMGVLRPLAAMAAASGLFQVVILDKSGRNFRVLGDHPNVHIVRFEHEELPQIFKSIYDEIVRRDRWIAGLEDGSREMHHVPANLREHGILVIADEFSNTSAYLRELDRGLYGQLTSFAIQIAQEGRAMGVHIALAAQRPDATQVNTTLRSQLNGITLHMRDATDANLADAPGSDSLEPGYAVFSRPGGYETIKLFYPSDDELRTLLSQPPARHAGEPMWIRGHRQPTTVAAEPEVPRVTMTVPETHINGTVPPDLIVQWLQRQCRQHADFANDLDTLFEERVITIGLALVAGMSENAIMRAVWGGQNGRYRTYVKMIKRHVDQLAGAYHAI